MQLFQRKAIVLLIVFVLILFFPIRAATNWAVNWHPSGNYFAICGDYSTLHPLYVYSFDKSHCSFTMTDSRQMISAGNSARGVAWSPAGNYLAVGVYTGGTNAQLRIYSFNGSRMSGSPVATQNYAQVGTAVPYLDAIAWHPSGNYIAIGGGNNPSSANYPLKIYSFNGSTLSETDSKSILYMIRDINWDSTGSYLIAGGNAATGSPEVYTYSFNAGTLTQITTKAIGGDTCIDYFASLSPDNQFALLGGYTVTSGLELQVYPFNNGSLGSALDSRNYGTYLIAAQFHPHQQYVAIGGETPDSGHEELEVYGFDSIQKKFTTNPLTKISQANSVCSVDWSKDGRFLLIGGKGDVLDTYWAYYGGSKGLGLTSYDGTQYPIYLPSNKTLRTSEYVRGSVTFAGGLVVEAGNGARLNIHTPICHGLDLRSTGSLTLDHNLILDSNITLSNGGIIDAQGSTIFLYGDLYVTPNSLVKFVSDAVIDGQWNNLTMGKYSQLFLDSGVTVTLKNVVVKNEINTISCPPVRCSDWYSKACFDNVIFALNDDFTFKNGQMFVHNDVDFTGTSKFSYRSVRPSYIAHHSNLIFDPNTTFEFYPSTTYNTLIQMADKTSAIVFDDSTLLTTPTGIRLTKGSVYLDNKITLSVAADSLFTGLTTVFTTAEHDFTHSVAWSPDGRFLAVGNGVSGDGRVNRLYSFDGTTLTLVDTTVEIDITQSVAWSPDGRFLAVGNNGQANRLYRLDGTTLTLVFSTAETESTYSVAWSPDGQFLATGNAGAPTRIYRLDGTTLTLIHSTAETDQTISVAWSPDGRFLATGCNISNSNRLYSFDGSTLTLVQSFESSDHTKAVAWSPDGHFLATANYAYSLPNRLYSFNGTTLTLVQSITGPFASTELAWSPDGRFLALGNSYSGFKLYRLDDETLTSIYSQSGGGYSVAWSPDGRFLAVGTSDTEGNIVYGVNFTYGTSSQCFSNGIIFGDSALGSAYDLDVHSRAANRINLYGKLWQDSVNSCWIFDSRDSYLSLNRYDSKFKITNDTSMSNWKKQHIIKASADNTLFLQDNQIWEANTDYNLAPLETFEFMNDLIIPDNQIVNLSTDAVIDGQGHNLILGKYSQLLVDSGITVTFKNMTIKNTHNTTLSSPIHCEDNDGKICLDNVILAFNEDCAFTKGQMFFHNDIAFTGTSKFSYQSAQPSYIVQHSNVIFSPNTIFEYYPKTANNSLIQMADKTSALIFNGSTLQTTHTGINLTKGSVYFDNKVTLSSADNTLATLTTVTTANYTQAASSVSWSRDGEYLAVCGHSLAPNTSLIVYAWNGSTLTLLDSKDYSTYFPTYDTPYVVSWSPNGNYLAVGGEWLVSPGYQCILYSWNGSSLSQIFGFEGGDGYQYSIAWHPSSEFFAVVSMDGMGVSIFDTTGNDLFDGYCTGLTYSVAWSSDGNYVAVGAGEYVSGANIFVYRWNSGDHTLSQVASTTMGTLAQTIVYSLAWSPDGKTLAAGGGIGDATDVAVYSWDGSSLNQVATKDHGAGAQTVAWSPDGKVLSVGGSNGSSDLILYNWTESSLNPIIQTDFGITASGQSWSSDGRLLAVCGNNGSTDLKIYNFSYNYDSTPQGFSNGITFGNSALGSAYDLNVHALAAARINLYGKLWQDSLNSWTFDSRDSYLSLNRYDSKFKITSADSMNNWKKQHIIKSSEDNTIFLQDNQVWEANTDYNLAPEETFEFMNDLIIPDAQQVKFSSNAVIDGQGHDLILGASAQLMVDNQTTVTFKNMTIKNTFNTIDIPPLVGRGVDSTICLDNVRFGLSDDYTFTIGNIFFHNNVEFTGTSTFSYKSTQTSYIAEHTNLVFGPNTTFVYDPQSINQQLFSMKDKTSAMLFDGSSLKVTQTGIRLTKGSVFFDNKVELNSTIGRMFGLFPLASESWTEVDTVDWSPNGQFLAMADANGSMVVYAWDGSTLVQKASKSLGVAVNSVEWSPNGQYLAVGRRTSPRLLVYEWDGLTLTEKASVNYDGATEIREVSWSPDGQYLAFGGMANSPTKHLFIYEWDGSTLTLKWEQLFGDWAYTVDWCPTGRFLAVGGQAWPGLVIYEWDGASLVQTAYKNITVWKLNWSVDGKFIAVGTASSTALIVYEWDGGSLTEKDSKVGDNSLGAIRWSPNGKYLAYGLSVSYAPYLTIYDWDGALLTEKISETFGSNLLGLGWSPNGSYLAAGGSNGTTDLIVYGTDMPQTYSNGIIFGNSVLGSAYDLDVNVLAGARVNVFGNFMYDNVN